MKRLALKAEKVGNSTKNPNYHKYLIEIIDKNGQIEKIPVYGKDMQHALSRVVRGYQLEGLKKSLDRILIIGIILVVTIVTLIFKL